MEQFVKTTLKQIESLFDLVAGTKEDDLFYNGLLRIVQDQMKERGEFISTLKYNIKG